MAEIRTFKPEELEFPVKDPPVSCEELLKIFSSSITPDSKVTFTSHGEGSALDLIVNGKVVVSVGPEFWRLKKST